MAIDLSKLARTTSDWSEGNVRVTGSPKSQPKKGSVLDKMEVRARISDSDKKPASPVKVMILDDTQILAIMHSERSEKRKILSRLSDSQRRRVLARYRELQKVYDDASVGKLNLVNLDSIINNCLISPDEYQTNLLNQWCAAYVLPDSIRDFVDAVASIDKEGISAHLDEYEKFCDDNGIRTNVRLTVTQNKEKEAAGDEFPIDEDTELPPAPEDEIAGEGNPSEGIETSNEEPVEGSDFGGDTTDESDFDAPVTDSASGNCKVFEVRKAQDFDGVDDVIDYARGVVWSEFESEPDTLPRNAEYLGSADIVDVYVTEDEAGDTYCWFVASDDFNPDAITDGNARFVASKLRMRNRSLVARKVMDAVLDEIAEKPVLDPFTGEEVMTQEDKPILEALSEALEAYANGNPELLDTIATTTLGGDSTEEPKTEEEAELQEENEDLEDTIEDETGKDADDAVKDHKEEEALGDVDEHEVDEDDEEKVTDSAKSELEKLVKPFGADVTLSRTNHKATYFVNIPKESYSDEIKKNITSAVAGKFDIGKSNVESGSDDSYGNGFVSLVAEPVADSSLTEVECPICKLDEAAKEQEKEDKQNAKELARLITIFGSGKEITDSAIYSKEILNHLIDSLSSRVPALRKYNFKISDCAPCVCPVCAPASAPLNPPLSRNEYYDMCPVCPDYFDLVVASYDHPQCPNCEAFDIQSNAVCVNPQTCPQSYYPYTCTLQEIADLLNAAQPSEYRGIINANCCPMSDALHIAALTNNLGFIDNTFYKKHVNDSVWSFDEVPTCLKGIAKGAGSIKQVSRKTDSSFSLFGQEFELI